MSATLWTGLLSGALALGATPPSEADDVRFAVTSLEPDGELIDAELVDVDGDGRPEVTLAVRTESGERELRFHRLRPRGVEPEPYEVVHILEETLAYGFADVRDEPGRELVFLTGGGTWSYSLAKDGYRGNVQLFARVELIYDVPDPSELEYWNYVLQESGGDRVLLPARGGLEIWGPAPKDGATHAALSKFVASDLGGGVPFRDERRRRDGDDDNGEAEVRFTPMGITIEKEPDDGLFLQSAETKRYTFLSNERGYRAPALLDVNGDGAKDIVTWTGEAIAMHESRDGYPRSDEKREEVLPDYLDRDEVELRFVDLDGDGDPDLLAKCSDEVTGLDKREISLLVLLNDGKRLLPDKPHQILRFETNDLRVETADVNGDGRQDLALRKFDLPSMLGAVTGLEFRLTQLVFFGREGSRPFERKPALKQERVYDETGVRDIIANRELSLDLSGDGRADLVEIDLEGRVSIHRTTYSKSFFGGESWGIEETPWLRFESFGTIESIRVEDLNGDGLGDVVSQSDGALSFLMSGRPNRGNGGRE